jgi:hypothetical protein
MTIHDDLKDAELELERISLKLANPEMLPGTELRNLRARYARLEGEIDEIKAMLGEDES